jgi:hypothetical protein
VRVVRPIEIRRHLERIEIAERTRERGIDVGFGPGFIAEHVERFRCFVEQLLNGRDRIDVAAHLGDALHRRLGRLRVVPEAVATRPLFEFG